jgi:hypothetical protein
MFKITYSYVLYFCNTWYLSELGNEKYGTYSDQQNRVLLVTVFIQKAITYSCVNKIQICKHESCST